MDKVVTSERVLLDGDFNGHVSSDMGGLERFMWGFGTGQIRDGGIRLLEWGVGKWLCLMNTCFKKTKSWLITFRSGETETMIACMLLITSIDIVLMLLWYHILDQGCEIIPGEEIVSQHCLLLVGMVLKKKVRSKAISRKKLQLWRLRESGERTVC